MARTLTNKQLQIVVDEIYEKVSLPIVEENNRLLNEVEVSNNDHPYLVDCNVYNELSVRIKELKDLQISIQKKYCNIEINGFVFSNNFGYAMSRAKDYTKHIKTNSVNLHKVLSKTEIEKQVVLAGNSDIPVLIEQLILKLSATN